MKLKENLKNCEVIIMDGYHTERKYLENLIKNHEGKKYTKMNFILYIYL